MSHTSTEVKPDGDSAAVGPREVEVRADAAAVAEPLTPTIFHETWWLESACDGNGSVAEVSSGGKLVGRLPYLLVRRKGLAHVVMPTLTHFLGPALIDGEGTANARFLRRFGITRELIAQLPSATSCEIKCHAGIGDVIAFQTERFHTSVQFTHEIEPLREDELWKRIRHKTRNVIRRAQEKFDVVTLNDAGAFIDLYAQNLEKKSYLDLRVCRNLIATSLSRRRGQIFAAKNRQGDLVAANLCVWDAKSSYYLMSTRTSKAGNGAGSLLAWRAILDAAQRNLVFDMDGLTNDGGILFYAGFGAEIRPRYTVRRYTLIGHLRFLVQSVRNKDGWYF